MELIYFNIDIVFTSKRDELKHFLVTNFDDKIRFCETDIVTALVGIAGFWKQTCKICNFTFFFFDENLTISAEFSL